MLLAAAVALGASLPACVARAADADYADPGNWLCRPGRHDACSSPQDATIIAADGSMTHETYRAAGNPPIDCFYVYPTVSTEATGNADLTVTAALRNAASLQFARFGTKCRLFAPLYRQVTLTALDSLDTGTPLHFDGTLGYRDVLAAWKHYVAHDNQGRGFVLIGHSQGSAILTQLLRNEIDGRPIQARLLSAILMGTTLQVPTGADVGGSFKHIPVCRADAQLGCVIAFASYRATAPPPANARFGKAPAGRQAVCANPAALGGGSGWLDAYLPSARISRDAMLVPRSFAWTTPPRAVQTPFVKVPAMLSAACIFDEHGSYLAVTVHAVPGAARVADISGDVVLNGQVQPDWGLHLLDANLTMGNLLHIVGEQSKAYAARKP